MNKVYLHRSMAHDELLGRVGADGRVYDERFGPDEYIGRVNLEDGKIYVSRVGPDEYIGRVKLKTGEVHLSMFGPDKYMGKVTKDGKIMRHKHLAPDEYLGRVDDMLSIAHGAAAFLLLILPAIEEDLEALARQAEKEAQEKAPKVSPGDKKPKPV
jgi:hypothetical protein